MNDVISRNAAITTAKNAYTACGDRSKEDYRDMLIACLEELPSAQPEQRWIPCSVRLPKQGQEVICQCRANIIKVLKLDADDDWYQDAEHCYMGGFVTAWMPLPEPYKEGQE